MVSRTRQRTGISTVSTRPRSRQRAHPSYGWTNWQDRFNPATYYPFYEVNNDVIGSPTADHNWYHDRFRGHPGRLSGKISYTPLWYNAPTEEWDLENVHIGMGGYKDSWARHIPTSLSTNPLDYVNAAIIRGNPGNSAVDLTEFLVELRDLRSSFIPRRLQSIPIAILFGVLPFLSDIESLINITHTIDARIKEINNLVGKTKKKRYGLGNAQAQTSTSSSWAFGTSYKQVKKTKVKAWVVKTHTIEHNKLKPPPTWGRDRMAALLLSDLPFITAWNLMPWSWLIDYFVNVNQYLTAYGNKIPGYSISNLCICVEEKTTGYIIQSGRDLRYDKAPSLRGGSWSHLTQRRLIVPDPSPVFPSFHPILSNGQIGNILALGLSRF